MSNFTTELATAISTGADIEEFFRQHLEHAINSLLQYELTSFLDYEKWDPIGYNSGNSRNGGYQRKFKTKYGPLNIHVPRDRMGEFKQQTLPPHRQSDESLEQTIIQLYRKGITTREITDLIEKMYGHHYSAGHVSNIGKLVDKDVKAFHSRRVKPNYVVIYCDATWLPVRRDGVAREALHVLVGIDAEGYKEVLDYALYPTESSANYQEMLRSLKARGLEQVGLFVSDGIIGLPDAVTEIYPKARHQGCWTHLQRNAMHKVRTDDRSKVADELKRVYGAESKAQAEERLATFCQKWQKKYPKLASQFSEQTNLFSFFDFPAAIRKSLYTNNLVESLNKRLKRVVKAKEQFSNEDALERVVCTNYLEYNLRNESRRHHGFSKVHYELHLLFE